MFGFAIIMRQPSKEKSTLISRTCSCYLQKSIFTSILFLFLMGIYYLNEFSLQQLVIIRMIQRRGTTLNKKPILKHTEYCHEDGFYWELFEFNIK